MDDRWKRRLREIAVAGGAALLAGCPIPGGVCNANPDPCCSAPESAECKAATECMKEGRTWENSMCVTDDAGATAEDLSKPLDAAHD
jgi:hypothetical protein